MSDNGHIFISYKSEQRDLAFKVRDQLGAWGYDPWVDVDRLRPGTYWANDIDHALKTCRACLGIMTPPAVRSRYVTNEWDMAIMTGKLFLPLMFQPTEPHYKYVDIQYIDFTQGEAAFGELRQQLDEHQPSDTRAADDPYHDYLGRLYDRINRFLSAKLIASLQDDEGRPEPIHLTGQRTRGAVDVLFEKRDEIDPLFAIGGLESEAPDTYDDFAEAFHHYDGRVLLLGEPGAGKTITLLHYGRDAVVKRRQNPAAPLPILGIIPTWDVDTQPPLADWLANSYDAPSGVAGLIESGAALLLLDGLDELGGPRGEDDGDAFDPRLAFIQNLPDHGQILLSCRRADYEAIGHKAPLRGAITLQALNNTQFERYLESQPELMALIQNDPQLADWLDTPLLLSYFAFAYEEMQPAERQRLAEIRAAHDLRDRIFDSYVRQRYERETRKAPVPFTLAELYLLLGKLAAEDVMGYQYGAPDNILIDTDFERVLPAGTRHDFRDLAIRLQLIEEISAGTYRFLHAMLRDYFAYTFASQVGSIAHYPYAYRALGVLGDKRAYAMLKAVATDPTTERRPRIEAICGIVLFHDIASVPYLIELMSHDEIEIRKFVVHGLAYHPSPDVIPALERATRDDNPVVRGHAAWGLGYVRAENALDALAALLDDRAVTSFDLETGELQVRDKAMAALKRIGTPQALALLDG